MVFPPQTGALSDPLRYHTHITQDKLLPLAVAEALAVPDPW
jgi:hypothetical protein